MRGARLGGRAERTMAAVRVLRKVGTARYTYRWSGGAVGGEKGKEGAKGLHGRESASHTTLKSLKSLKIPQFPPPPLPRTGMRRSPACMPPTRPCSLPSHSASLAWRAPVASSPTSKPTSPALVLPHLPPERAAGPRRSIWPEPVLRSTHLPPSFTHSLPIPSAEHRLPLHPCAASPNCATLLHETTLL
ncbi:hypothetical protein EV356DRAFT_359224 [Viridothelium virens]|uniref:Uncharacterized protein n=1 Tax=Viridothelium virens TaxID=1048519 RepID=A0A6A6HJU8_VIRVR|nr:hypothetical protein EV356DRAFT_359224 [Viridothelium virens]